MQHNVFKLNLAFTILIRFFVTPASLKSTKHITSWTDFDGSRVVLICLKMKIPHLSFVCLSKIHFYWSGHYDFLSGSGLTTWWKQPGGDSDCTNNLYNQWTEIITTHVVYVMLISRCCFTYGKIQHFNNNKKWTFNTVVCIVYK